VLHPKIGAHKKSLPFLDVQEMGGSSFPQARPFAVRVTAVLPYGQ
jgi:hypothetical protein